MKTRFNLNEAVASQRRILFVCEYPYELQQVPLGDIAAADTFTLTFKGQTTGAVTFAADMTLTIKAALEALSNVEAGDITVMKHASLQTYYIGFGGSLVDTGVGMVTVTPTGFTPGSITRLGYRGAPVTGATFTAAQMQVSKNGGADANAAGTVTEIGYGRYYYQATQAELNTRGTLSLVTVRSDIATTFPTVEVVASDVLYSCVAQAGASNTITLDAAASGVSDFYLPCTVWPKAGTGAGQGPRFATAYNGVTKVMTIAPDWAVNPASGTEVELRGSIPMASLAEATSEISAAAAQEIAPNGPIATNSSGQVSAILADRRGT